MLGRGIRVGDDPAARLQVRDAVAQPERADRDARVELARFRDAVADGARIDPAPVPLELRDDLHRAHLRRARDGAGREARAQQLERRHSVAQLADDLRDEVRHVRVALGLHEALDAHRARHADAREVVAPEVDEHRVLGAVLLRREQRRRVALAGRDRAGDRVELGAAAGALDDRLRRAADQREVPQLQKEEVRRRVDAAQRAVELDAPTRRWAASRAARSRPGRRRPRGCAPSPARRGGGAPRVTARARAARALPSLARQRGLPARRATPRPRATARQRRARDRTGQDVGNEEPALRHTRPVVRQRHRRLEASRPRRTRDSRRPARRSASASSNETSREPAPTKL